jgi:hypothetical protein
LRRKVSEQRRGSSFCVKRGGVGFGSISHVSYYGPKLRLVQDLSLVHFPLGMFNEGVRHLYSALSLGKVWQRSTRPYTERPWLDMRRQFDMGVRHFQQHSLPYERRPSDI